MEKMEMKKQTLLTSLALTLCLTSTAHAALVAVSIGGGTNNAVYDDVLDITWLANANLAASNTFGVAGINGSGRMTWDTAQSWISAMNSDGSNGYLGVNSWRQPTVSPVNEEGVRSCLLSLCEEGVRSCLLSL